MGIVQSFVTESMPPKPRWNVGNIPDLSNRVALITGGNIGLGYETAKALLSHNATVYIAARSEEKSQAAIKKLQEETGHTAIFLKLDLANKNAIQNAVNEFRSKETKLDMLFNNAGLMVPPIEQTTADGYDLQFGTMVLGHYIFTMGLIPPLLEAAQHSPDGKARVINTSSLSSRFTGKIRYDTLKDGDARKKYGVEMLYSQAKFANVLFANELARRYYEKGIVSTSLNPGNLRTGLQRHLAGIKAKIVDLMLYPAPYGALTQLWAGTAPEAVHMNGEYLVPWARRGQMNPAARDLAKGAELWTWLEAEAK